MTSADTNPKIEILPEHIIDQIKAGEVLERPASLLKELLENSLDAGSTEIHLHLIENGMDLLSIEDNGHGMTFKNLPYAFLRHATSKLKTFEDLYRLHSFGFRGEALASVAASARVTCTTQPKDLNAEGGKIIIAGGHTELLIAQQASTHGTAIYIKDLFFNTPARLKFIKSKVSEKSALKKMIYSFVLCHPEVTFTIKWDEKEKEIFKAVAREHAAERIAQVFFGRKAETQNLIFSEEMYDNYRVRVYFTKETYTTPQYRHHYLFANRRFFQDKSLHSALLRNLDVFWRFGESGHYVVQIDTPPDEIDVNVHPNKIQVKFLRSDVVYSLLVTAIKNGIKKVVSQMPTESISLESTPSFFSRADNQNFDLMNLVNDSGHGSGSNYSSSSYNDQSEYNLFNRESALTQEAPRFQRLQNQFLIADLGQPTLIDLKKLIVSYFTKELKSFSLSDESTGPLLISEPFKILKGKIDTQFETIKSLGFEFDRLNAEYIVLRTIPKFLPQALLASLSEIIIKYFNLPKTQQFESISFQKFFDDNFSESLLSEAPSAWIERVVNENACPEAMVELTADRLKSLFK
jgi:DNA mismatch repair protein MutL